MEIVSELTWMQLGSTSYYTAVAPILLGGGLTLFKNWVLGEEDVRNRVNLRKQILYEHVTKLHQQVLTVASKSYSITSLRGSPPQEPDVLSDHTIETFRVISVCYHLDLVQYRVKACYEALFLTAMLGVLCLLAAIAWQECRFVVATLSILALLAQLKTIGYLRGLGKRLEEYEKTT